MTLDIIEQNGKWYVTRGRVRLCFSSRQEAVEFLEPPRQGTPPKRRRKQDKKAPEDPLSPKMKYTRQF